MYKVQYASELQQILRYKRQNYCILKYKTKLMATVVNKRIAYTSQPLPICSKGLSDDMAALVVAQIHHNFTYEFMY